MTTLATPAVTSDRPALRTPPKNTGKKAAIIVSMALLDFIWTTQQFALIWMTTGGGPITSTEMLSTFTYKLAFTEYEFSVASAAAVVVLLLSMVLAFFYVRHQKARD